MASAYFHGKRVSPAHHTLLTAYERRHGELHINQGRRTLAEQAAFYWHYLRYGSPLAARPWGGAPHIKWGRAHHALDINDEVVDRVAFFYRANGVVTAFNVRGEPWHMDTLDEGQLLRAAARLTGSTSVVIRKGTDQHDAVKKLQTLLRAVGYKSVKVDGHYGIVTRRAVRRFQKKHKLKVDGVVGKATWDALRKVTR